MIFNVIFGQFVLNCFKMPIFCNIVAFIQQSKKVIFNRFLANFKQLIYNALHTNR